jgi:hypothetical protein
VLTACGLATGASFTGFTLIVTVARAKLEVGLRSTALRSLRTASSCRPADSSEMPHWLVAGGRRIPLCPGEHLIGRDPASAVQVDTPEVSRRHARILVSGEKAVLEDLGSKNGTTVGDSPIGGKRVLCDGDDIHLGPIVIVYRASRLGRSTQTVIGQNG